MLKVKNKMERSMIKKSHIVFILLTGIIALAGCQPNTEPPPPLTASLSEVTGLVEMKQAQQASFESAVSGSTLNPNGQVQTGDDGRARLDLSSGTIIRVAPASLFTLTSNEEVEGGLLTKIELEIGKVFIILNGGQADVQTPSGVASVRGSYLKVEIDPVTGDIYITCLEGTCSATNPNGEQIIFTNGQKVTLFHQESDGSWKSPLLGSMDLVDFQEWLENNNDSETKKYYDEGVAKLLAEATEAPTTSPTEPPAGVAPVLPPGGSSNACSQLEQPADGSALGKIGQTQFAWSEQPDAQYYVITFVNADGSRARIQTDSNSATFYIEVLPTGGSYEWFVTAYGSDGTEICSSNSRIFSKPQADPTEKPQPGDDNQEEPVYPGIPPSGDPPPTEDPFCTLYGPCYSPSCPGYSVDDCGN